VNYPTFYKVELPASTNDGFLGIPCEIRSSTRACSTGVNSDCFIPTL